MKLIVGGAFQGKKKAAMALTGLSSADFLDGAQCPLGAIFTCRGMDHFHAYIRRLLEDKQDIENLAEEVFRKNSEIVLISTELGYGIVPMDPFDRAYRERVGRICCQLAEKSEEVYRVVCGIPSRLKGGAG